MTIDILCRFDARDQAPVVFLRDTIQGDKIQVWNGQGNPKVMPLDYYKMTSPLSAEDERVLMERYKKATGKDDQVIRITHRLPRTSRPVPNVLAAPSNAQGENTQRAANAPRKANAKAIEAQTPPAAPVGDLPQAGETPAPLPATAAVAPPANETVSASLFRRIQELNQRSITLNESIASLQTQLANATTDQEATKQAIEQLKGEFEQALEAEAAEELRKRREMLAAITGVAPASSPAPAPDALQTAAQALHDAGTQQPAATPTPAPETSPKAASKGSARGSSGKFAKKDTPAPAKK